MQSTIIPFHTVRSIVVWSLQFCGRRQGADRGPITLPAYLFHKGRPFLSDPALFSAVASVLLFVDEPALCLDAPVANAVSEEQRLNALAATLEDARIRGAYAGLHCCAARPFERMCRVKPDIISFDAHEGLEIFFADCRFRYIVDRPGMSKPDSGTIERRKKHGPIGAA